MIATRASLRSLFFSFVAKSAMNVFIVVVVSRAVLAHLEGNFFNPKFPAILP